MNKSNSKGSIFSYIIGCTFPYLIIFGSLSFTIITTIVGYHYIQGSAIYIIYNVAIALLGYGYYAFNMLRQRKLFMSDLIAIIIIIVLLLTYLWTETFGEVSIMASDYFKYMIVWSIPAFLYGVVFLKKNNLKKVLQGADIFMILITITVCINGVYYYINGVSSASVSGSTTYQTMSYLSALSIGMNYYLIISKSPQYRPLFFQTSHVYKIICFIMLIIQVTALILTGGRGGMILAIIYFIMITIMNNRMTNKITKKMVVLFSVIGLAILFSSNNEMIVSGLNRMFQFIGANGIDWAGTSGRAEIYTAAVELIKDRPILGYGMWGLFAYIRNPHNIFLEWMLGGGVLGLIIGIIVVILTIRRYFGLYKINQEFTLLFIFFLYNFVMLMFSGTYLCAPSLWFFIGAMLGSRRKCFVVKKQKQSYTDQGR